MQRYLTQQQLKEILIYDPKTGVFKWKKYNKYHNLRGQVAGHKSSYGYKIITINYKRYRAHQLVWLYVYGEFPKNQIDHINHNRSDNRISNLREVDQFKNAKNRTKQNNNTSGYNGVRWRKTRKKWRARIMVNHKNINLGHFENKEDAIQARKQAEIKYGFHSNHGEV